MLAGGAGPSPDECQGSTWATCLAGFLCLCDFSSLSVMAVDGCASVVLNRYFYPARGWVDRISFSLIGSPPLGAPGFAAAVARVANRLQNWGCCAGMKDSGAATFAGPEPAEELEEELGDGVSPGCPGRPSSRLMAVRLDNRAQVGVFPRENLKPFHKTVLNQLTSVYTFSKPQMDVDFMRVGLLLSVAFLASFLAPVRANDSAKRLLPNLVQLLSDQADSTKVAFASESDRCPRDCHQSLFSENAKPQGKSGRI
ncbi:unnamed protein product [Sphagnum compactum]